MDLNHIALWLAAVPALSLLWYSARSPRRAFDWLIVSVLVLSVLAVGWFAFRESAGYVGLALVVLTFILPARLSNAAVRAAEEQRYARARLLARVASLLHPTENWRVTTRMYEAFALAQSAHIGDAEALLQVLARGSGDIASVAAGQRLALMNRWRELKSFGEREGLFALHTRPTLFLLYVRALGELGSIEELARFLRAQDRVLAHSGVQNQALAYLFAFSGEPALTERALAAAGSQPSAETHDYWRAVALEHAGQNEAARQLFARLRQSADAIVRGRAERHYTKLGQLSTPEPVSPEVRAVVRHFERVLVERQRFAPETFGAGGRAPVTYALGALCLLVYLVGSWGDFAETREDFGDRWAFAAKDIFAGEWWRAGSYLFVHQNWLHLLMNVLGLAVLGPFVERAFGRVRFLTIYFTAGATGTALYLLLARLSLNHQQLVGASGCIMGLLGAHVAVMLRVWLRHRLPLARAMFFRLLVMVALQVVFDRTTPQIAALAHGAGLLGGFVCALCLRDEVSARAGARAK